MSRVYNFSAGPATLPEEVVREAQEQLLDYQGSGLSIMEASHRGKEYAPVHDEAVENFTRLMNLDDDHSVLFLQGGATGQFAMVPLNLLGAGQTADYTHSGAWASKAIKEAKIRGQVNVIADTSSDSPARMPDAARLATTPGAAYLHITTNETIEGTQWKTMPQTEAPLVADMSSDILSRPLDFNQFGLIYAGAQKNIGPAGVTLVVIRKDLAERAGDEVPLIWRYATHIKANSLSNTPPCFNIYMCMLVSRWLLKQGGAEAVATLNREKAGRLYTAIDGTEFYRGTADIAHRSDMNVTFRLPSEELEAAFIAEAATLGMKGLKGHRSVGGIRASIYNAFPADGVDALIAFMQDFEARQG